MSTTFQFPKCSIRAQRSLCAIFQVLTLLLVPLLSSAQQTVSVVRDSAFHFDGRLLYDLLPGQDITYSIAAFSDGDMAIAGYNATSSGNFAQVMRVDVLGELSDKPEVRTVATFSFSNNAIIRSIKVDASDRAIIAGRVVTDGIKQAFIARLLPNLELDNSFGTAGVVYFPFENLGAEFWDVELQQDGKIVAGGMAATAQYETAVAFTRVDASGTPDSLFSQDGSVVVAFDEVICEINSIGIDQQGNIYGCGWLADGILDSDFLLCRFVGSGKPDPSFGTNGFVRSNYSFLDNFYDLEIGNDGSILAAGNGLSFGESVNVVYKYKPNGEPDDTFGGTGIGYTWIPNPADIDDWSALYMTTDANENIYAGGMTLPYSSGVKRRAIVHKLRPDGSLATAFGDEGTLFIADENYSLNAYKAILQNDSYLYIAGITAFGGPEPVKAGVYSISTTGSSNPIFGHEGLAYFSHGTYSESFAGWVPSATAYTSFGSFRNTTTAEEGIFFTHFDDEGEIDLGFGDDGQVLFNQKTIVGNRGDSLYWGADAANNNRPYLLEVASGSNGMASDYSFSYYPENVSLGMISSVHSANWYAGLDIAGKKDNTTLKVRSFINGNLPNPNWGNGSVVELDLSAVLSEFAPANIFVTADGYRLIILQGEYNGNARLVGLLLNQFGEQELTFGSNGWLTVPLTNGAPAHFAQLYGPNNAFSLITIPSDNSLAIHHFTFGGQAVAGFGTNGVLTLTNIAQPETFIRYEVNTDGNVYALFNTITSSSPVTVTANISRFTTSGLPDTNWGVDGNISLNTFRAESISLTDAGQIWLTGAKQLGDKTDAAIYRLIENAEEIVLVKNPGRDLPQLQVYPNPASSGSNIQLEWNNRQSGPYTLRLLSTNGRLVQQQNGTAFAGTMQLALALPSGLSSGVYTLVLETGDAVVIRKLVVR